MIQNNKNKRNRWLTPSLLLVLIATLSPGDGKIAGAYIDKLVHFLIFFFLSWNLIYKFEEQVLPFIFGSILLGIGTEFIQQIVPGRNLELADIVADTLGIISAYMLCKFFPLQMNAWLLKIGA